MSRNYEGTTVAEGDWLYEGAVAEMVEIVAFDFDYWFELPGDDGRSEWKSYPLNPEGFLYYIRAGDDPLPMTPFQSQAEAQTWANAQPWAPITWRHLLH